MKMNEPSLFRYRMNSLKKYRLINRMSGEEDIIRAVFDNYNNTTRPKELEFITSSLTSVIDRPGDYHVTIEKLEVPINNKFMPIDNDTEPFRFCIFSDDKGASPKLPFGPHYYSFEGPFYSVDDFLKKINDVILKDLGLGQFVLEEENDEKWIYFLANSDDFPLFELYTMYFDLRMVDLLSFEYNLNDSIVNNGVDYVKFNEVKSFSVPSPQFIFKTKQQTFTFPKFYKLKSIRVFTDLPIDYTFMYDMQSRGLSKQALLGEVSYNSMQMYKNSNLLYIPNIFRYVSLTNSSSVDAFRIWFRYIYANGGQNVCFLDVNEYCSITIAFKRKEGI